MRVLQGRLDPGRVKRTLTALTTLLLVASVAMNVILGRRLSAFIEPATANSIVGMVAPSLNLRSLDNRPVEVRFDGRPTILYYFSPKCPWCEKNWLNVQALRAGTSDRYRFIGLSTVPDVSGYMGQRNLSFEVYTGLGLETARLYHLGGTPQTVVVGADGLVVSSWAGAYTGRRQHEIEHAFGVVLPGTPDAAH